MVHLDVSNDLSNGAETIGEFEAIKVTGSEQKELELTWKYPNRDALSTIVAAADFAARKHRNQRRKDAELTPYINHPIGVANILTAEGKVTDSDLIQVAMLHDTIEDTDVTLEELVENFGIRVALLVAELSDDKSLERKDRKRIRIENAHMKSSGAKVVAMCDKIHNLRDLMMKLPVGWDEERRHEYFNWAEKVVQHYYSENAILAKILKDIFKTHKMQVEESKAKAKKTKNCMKSTTEQEAICL